LLRHGHLGVGLSRGIVEAADTAGRGATPIPHWAAAMLVTRYLSVSPREANSPATENQHPW
jgi:hypothetical protein